MTFIGPRPTDGPKYTTPFRAVYGTVLDANDVEIAVIDLETSADDIEMSQAIADALNEKFGGEPKKSTVTAEVYPHPTIEGYRWLVVDGKAYFEGEGIRRSVYSPADLANGYAFEAAARAEDVEVDPALFAGVVGNAG